MWFLDFRTRDVGGPVASTPLLYEDDAWRGSGLSALPPHPGGLALVVHGYNNDRTAGKASIAGFAQAAVQQRPSLSEQLLVGVLWPGDSVLGFLSYPTEEADADGTAAALAATLAAGPLSAVPSFVAHSLGCRVVLQTLDTLARIRPGRQWVDELILLAAAVDADALARADRYTAAARLPVRLVNVASTADRVLELAFPAGDWLAGIFTGGYTRRALGFRGPSSEPPLPRRIDGFQVGPHGVGHGDYLGGGNPKRLRAAALAGRAILHEAPLHY
jgi:hypothetical protein